MASRESKHGTKSNVSKVAEQSEIEEGYVTPGSYELEKILNRGSPAYTHVNEVWPNVYIGDEQTAKDKYNLKRLGITHVLNAAEGTWNNVDTGADKLLVHCVMGRSRSATLFLAYLMICENMTLVDAIEQVKTRRRIVPNWGFLKQLRELDTQLQDGRKGALD